MLELFLKSLIETITMVFASGVLAFAFGLPLGVFLFTTAAGGINEHRRWNRFLGLAVNVGRSVPFIILLVSIIPLTRFLVGTAIGTIAAIVPLSVAATPFVARLVEGALQEVPRSLIEAATSLGADRFTVVTRVLIPEALPGILNAATITLVTLVGYSAMAGVVGGGGLGDLGIRYGYQRFDPLMMLWVVLALLVLVQGIQFLGEHLVRRVRVH